MTSANTLHNLEIIDENTPLPVLSNKKEFMNKKLDLIKHDKDEDVLPRNLNEIDMISSSSSSDFEDDFDDNDDNDKYTKSRNKPANSVQSPVNDSALKEPINDNNNAQKHNNNDDNSSVSSYVGSDLSPEEELQKKKNLLYTLKRFQKKGFTLSRNYTLNSDLFEMKAEVDSIKREANLDASVATMKKGLTISTYLLEMLNNQFDPINAKLDGWSNQVKDDVDHGDYDEVFEELYDKYSNRFQMPPEMRLVSMLGTSALQYHVAQIVVNRTLNTSKTDEILKKNPQIKKDIMTAVNNDEKIGKKMIAEQQKMSNPSEIDNILKELQIEDENSKILSTDF